jgi:DNA-binding transcriptional MerR regulator
VVRISELARAAGVGISTVRFYERRGLVTPTTRTNGDYRHHDHEALRRLKFVRRAQRLGFTLSEVEQRVRDLERVRRALLEVAANGVQEQCPVLAALNGSTKD